MTEESGEAGPTHFSSFLLDAPSRASPSGQSIIIIISIAGAFQPLSNSLVRYNTLWLSAFTASAFNTSIP